MWRDLQFLPDRFGDAFLSSDFGARAVTRRTCRGLREGARVVPDEYDSRSGLHRHAGTRSWFGRALDGRPETSRGARRARLGWIELQSRAGNRVWKSWRGRTTLSRGGQKF